MVFREEKPFPLQWLKLITVDTMTLWPVIVDFLYSNKLTNSADPGQTAAKEQSDEGLHCLHRYVCPNISGYYHKFFLSLF